MLWLGIALMIAGLFTIRWLLNQIGRDEDCWNYDDQAWLHQEGITLEERI